MRAYCIEADDSGLFLAMTHKVTVLLAGDQTLLRVDCSVLCDNMTTLYIHSFGRDHTLYNHSGETIRYIFTHSGETIHYVFTHLGESRVNG